MTTERVVLNAVWRAVSHDGTRLFRNQVGQAWAGKSFRLDSNVVVENPYRVTYGLHVGSGDLIGWTVYTIQPEDVGRKVAIFTSIEVKGEFGRASEGQKHWEATVRGAGGISCIARSARDAATVIEEYRPHE